MHKITDENVCYKMSPDNTPCTHVPVGESICFSTRDCYGNLLKTENDIFTADMWDKVNPATGPVFIEGAEPGAIMRIDIEDIQVRNFAVMCLDKDNGALAKHIDSAQTAIYPIKENHVIINEKISIPIEPMIGVIGLAPAGEAVINSTPGEHGGNMDCREIAKGSSLYLPVAVEGGLLALGDLHAVMGDGEVCICGAEVSGEATVKTSIISMKLPTPCVETNDYIIFLASAQTLDECETKVLDKAHKFMVDNLKFSSNEAARLMSLVGQLRVAQVVDPLKTMKFLLPKKMLMINIF